MSNRYHVSIAVVIEDETTPAEAARRALSRLQDNLPHPEIDIRVWRLPENIDDEPGQPVSYKMTDVEEETNE